MRARSAWIGTWIERGAVSFLALAGCNSVGETSDTDTGRIHGSLASRYQGRWTSGEHDHDLTEVLSLAIGDPKKDSVTGFVLAEGLADLDGKPSGSGAGTFHSLADTYDGAVTGRLYHAYADLHAVPGLETFRIGRQMIVETPEVAYLDGLRAETADLGGRRIRLGAYAGAPVKIFASSTLGDSILGLFAQSRPWDGGRVRLDWMHVQDEGFFGPRENDLLGLNASQSFGTSLRLEGQHTRLENDPRDVRLRASWYSQDSDLVLQASWYRLLESQKDLTVPFDPFYATLFELFPYQQFGVLASKSLGSHLDLQTGFDLRRVEEDADVGQFNRDFDRAFATAGIRNVLPARLDLTLTGEAWDSPQTDIRTYGADLSRRFPAGDGQGDKVVVAAVGTYYSLFKYDLFQDRELDDVRTWYLRVDWKRSSRSSFDLRYEFEDDPTGEYHSVRLGATWRF